MFGDEVPQSSPGGAMNSVPSITADSKSDWSFGNLGSAYVLGMSSVMEFF